MVRLLFALVFCCIISPAAAAEINDDCAQAARSRMRQASAKRQQDNLPAEEQISLEKYERRGDRRELQRELAEERKAVEAVRRATAEKRAARKKQEQSFFVDQVEALAQGIGD